MAAKKKTGKSTRSKTDALVDDLSTQVKKLAKQLKAAEKERDALIAKLDKQKKKAKEAVRIVEKRARKELKKTRASVAPATGKGGNTIKDHAPATSGVEATGAVAISAVSGAPDDSWTVTRLRAEARAQNVTGYSRMNKAQLVGSLS